MHPEMMMIDASPSCLTCSAHILVMISQWMTQCIMGKDIVMNACESEIYLVRHPFYSWRYSQPLVYENQILLTPNDDFNSSSCISLQTYQGPIVHIDGLVQERRISIVNAWELRLSCTKPSTYIIHINFPMICFQLHLVLAWCCIFA